MNINKNNYEAWFIDYYDGNLSATQVAELMLFLENNPTLKDDFYSFENISLNELDEKINFSHKNQLKKNDLSLEQLMIAFVDGTLSDAEQKNLLALAAANPELKKQLELYQKTKLPIPQITFEHKTDLKNIAINTDELLSRFVDGTLTTAEQEKLQQMVATNTQLKNELATYQKTKLVIDNSIIFPDKESLKRKKEVVLIPLFMRYAVAAAIALLVGVYFLMNNETPNGQHFTFNKRFITKPNRNSESPIEINTPNYNNQLVNKNSNRLYYKIQPTTKSDTTIIDNNNSIKLNNNVLVKSNTVDASADSLHKNMVLVRTSFDDEIDDDMVNNTKPNNDFLSWKEIVAMKVKDKLLPEQNESNLNDTKKFTWYDLALIGVKGINKVLKNDIELKKRVDETGNVVAYQFSTPKNEFNIPIK